MRDSQRSRVYACDKSLLDWARSHGELVTYPTRWEMQAFADRVQQWAANKRGRVTTIADCAPEVRVRKGGTRSLAYQARWQVKILRAHFNNVILLHELAHLYTTPGSKHSAPFCAMYLTLVREFISEAAGAHLLTLFKEHRVRHRAIRRRGPVSPERRAVLIAQLAAARGS